MTTATMAPPSAGVVGVLAPAAEGVVATRNALTLGVTLIIGMALSLFVRLFLVRLLGPEAFGELRFAENAAEMLFIGLTLGVDTIIRREAAVAPQRARSYLWGLLVLRLAGGAVLLSAIGTGLALSGYSRGTIMLFCVLGVAQVLMVLNNSYSALEHASGQVGWIARVTLLFKLLWAGMAIVVLLLIPSGIGFAAVFLGVEALRFVRLSVRSSRRHGIDFRPDLRVAGFAAVASLPFFVHYLAHSLYARLGVWWLGGSVGDLEVGWYGAAATLAAIAMLGMPLVSWVLVPSSARVARHAGDGLGPLIGGALRMALLVAVPVSLLFALWAPLWLTLLFGEAYLPAVGALRALAPTFTLAYVATICSISLIQRERIRTVAVVSIAGLAVSVALNAVLIPWGARTGAMGGAAAGAAYATLVTEVLVTAVMIRLSWDPSWKGPLLRTAGGLTLAVLGAISAKVILSDSAAALASVAVFGIALLVTRAVGTNDIEFCRSVMKGRKHHASTIH
jgi:O-antigen/teichoic acid export membrane protein